MKMSFSYSVMMFLALIVAQVTALETSIIPRDPSMPDINGETLTLTLDTDKHSKPSEMQARLDMMQRVLRKLPVEELEKYEIDLSADVLEGTEMASRYVLAWEERQQELRKVSEAMMKPAEDMAKLVNTLRSSESSAEIKASFKELESMVSDIDNARDFKHIGGWPTLLSYLEPTHTPAHRSLAAWVIGTAVKNDYDYQLWILEAAHNDTYWTDKSAGGDASPLPYFANWNGLQHLIDILLDPTCSMSPYAAGVGDNDTVAEQEVDCDAMQRRAMYAIAACARGNVDVQSQLHTLTFVPQSSKYVTTDSAHSKDTLQFVDALQFYADLEGVGGYLALVRPERSRKVWGFVEDMLQERLYIRSEVMEVIGNFNDTDNAALLEQVSSLTVFSDQFDSATWKYWASITGKRYASYLTRIDKESLDKAERKEIVVVDAIIRSVDQVVELQGQ